jgi:hypothetical protein
MDLLFLTEKNESTKSLTIKVIAAIRKGTIAQIRRSLITQFGKKISYQAVRQTLLELEQSNAIQREGKEFKINEQWVSQLRDFAQTLTKATSRQMKIIDKHTTNITLRSLEELGNFILYSLEQKYFMLHKGKALYIHLGHLWIPFSDPQKKERLQRLFSSNKTCILVQGSTLGDKLLAHWYKKFGTVKLGVKRTVQCETIVHEDCVVQIYFDPALQQLMDEVYRLKLNFDLPQKISEMTHRDFEIHVVITRNSRIAEQIRAAMPK